MSKAGDLLSLVDNQQYFRYEILDPKGKVVGVVSSADEVSALKAYFRSFGHKPGYTARKAELQYSSRPR